MPNKRKKQQLALKRQQEDALLPDDIEKHEELELTMLRGIGKAHITNVINDPITMIPLTIRNYHITGNIWRVGEDYIRSWLDGQGYTLVVNWYASSIVDDITIDYK